jgi:hypothetical protein
MQNIDDDMTWLTNKMDDCDFEFVLTQYDSYEDDSGNNVVDSNVETTLMFGSANGGGNLAFHKDMNENANCERLTFEAVGDSYSSMTGINYKEPGAMVMFYNKLQLDIEAGGPVPVTVGGFIVCMCRSSIKSIKIYKITY